MNNKSYDKARKAAAAALVRVHRGGWSNAAADDAFAHAGLPKRERAFAGALFFGACERSVTLDFLLAPLLKRPVEKLDVEVRAVLECGAYQLLYMRVPPAAAVNESVKLVRAFGKSSAAGLMNAVLRRLPEHWGLEDALYMGGRPAPGEENTAGEALAAPPRGPDLARLPFADETERVCVTWSVSRAVADAVMAALPGEYDAFFAASFSTGELCLRTNTLKIASEALSNALKKAGAAVRCGQLPAALYARLAGPPAEDDAFLQGLYHVQGEASQFACACLDVQPGMAVLDLCAAPGGKTATLAEDMRLGEAVAAGGSFTACDIRPARLGLVRGTLHRLGIEGIELLENDASVYNEALAGQDRVLCDVPCSGLGVLAQRPDARGQNGENFAALPALQLKCLHNAARYVKKGGRLVYSTCTIRCEENEDVVRAFLTDEPAFCLAPPATQPLGAQMADGMMKLLPHSTGMDGFFVATLVRM